MKSSNRVLEENLKQLIARAYLPIRPRAEFVSELERQLAPWIASESAQPLRTVSSGSRRLKIASVVALAAAALFLISVFKGNGSTVIEDTDVVGPSVAQDHTPSRPTEGEAQGNDGDSQASDPFDRVLVDEQGQSGSAATVAAEGRQVIEEIAEQDLEEERVTQATLHGSVRSASDGKPIGAFTIAILPKLSLPQVAFPIQREFDAKDGRFEWDDIEEGEYTVFIRADDKAIWNSGVVYLGSSAPHAIAVELQAGVTIRGFVLDGGTGAAVPNALVVSEKDMPIQIVSLMEDEFPKMARAFTHSDADGGFVLNNLNPGEVHLRASSDKFASAWELLTVGESGSEGVLLRLASGGSVEGLCEHADGRPFVGGRIIVSRFSGGTPGGSMTYSSTVTGADGTYLANHLAPGTCVVLFYRGRESATTLQPRYLPLNIVEGETVRADFLGEQRASSISGVISDGEGKFIPFANLHVWSLSDDEGIWSGETADKEGRYKITGLIPGTYQLYAGPANSTVLAATLELGANDQMHRDIVLQGETLGVRVLSSATGEPVSLVDLFLLQRNEGGRDVVIARIFAEFERKLELSHLPLGTYDLVATSEGDEYARTIISDVWIDSEAGDKEVTVYLEPACALELAIVDEGGSPIEGVSVSLVGSMGDSRETTTTNASGGTGKYKLGRLYAGDWQVTLRKPGFQDAQLTASVKVGEVQILYPVMRVE
ncbi:MAG: hypothetical protein ACI8X5_000014 [Planctomycetota bacterium]|jgi:hypothetical protein